MKVHFKPLHGPSRPARVPFRECEHALAAGACHECGTTEDGSFKVQGIPGTLRVGHDRYTATARCVACGTHVGSLVTVVSTIFGIEEDQRVLNGRARCY